MSWLSGLFQGAGAVLGLSSANKDRKLQKQFAQNQIQWKVADAKAAGVHPLYALGAPTISFSPVGDGGAGASLSELGQDLTRARMAGMDSRQRAAEFAATAARNAMNDRMAAERHAIDLEHGALQNDLLRSQLARMNSAQVGPSSPSAAPGSVEFQPSRPTVSARNDRSRDPGTITDYRYAYTDGGRRLVLAPSTDWQGNVDDFTNPQTLGWTWRNNVIPFFNRRALTPPDTRDYPVRPGYEWHWTGMDWVQRRIRDRTPPRIRGRAGASRPLY